ncbi:unnamed protein product [Owenia fusiformis]|uniref:Replication protein A subunit n=1 Tax=Owenia fusiformis TaxID=6347 RepID=A0A8J1YAL5_OWEFU|nr:unnamed protein product [Owenia fusiformis]
MSLQLTAGAIQEIMSGGNVDKPILQVLGQKKIAGGNGADRYRLLLSDGYHSHSSAMLATQLNSMIDNNELEKFTVIELQKYICNTIQEGRRVMILLEMNVVSSGGDVGATIGNPVAYKPGQPKTDIPAQPAAQPTGQPAATNGASAPKISKPNTPARGGFYNKGPAAAAAQQSPAAPNTPGGSAQRIFPISHLTPYQNRWCIRARCTNKSAIRTWSNSRGEGKLFSMNFRDESKEIRATAFKEEVDKYHEMIEVNKVYYIQKGTLKTANKQYSNVDNDYEMTFNRETIVTLCEEETDLPSVSFKFIAINELGNNPPDTIIDVLGVCKSASDMNVVIGKTSQKEIKKRDLDLVDQSGVSVRMTLWGNDAENFDGSATPVIAVKGCKMSDFGGRSLSVLSSSQMIINPDIEEAHTLRGWYDSVGSSMDFDTYKRDDSQSSGGGHSANWKNFSQVVSENLGHGDKADYFTSKATVMFLKRENCMYMACPSESCNKKLVDNNNGTYRCEKCSKEYDTYKWCMILNARLSDHTDQQWATCFQESAETLLGRPASEIGAVKDSGDETAFDNLFQEATFKQFIFKLRTKMETYNEESRLKTVCVNVSPVNHEEYSKKLIEDIQRLTTK